MKCSGTSEKSSLYTFIKQQTWWKNIFKKHIINKYIFYNIYLTKVEEENIIYYKMTRNNFLKVFFNIKYKTTVVYIFLFLLVDYFKFLRGFEHYTIYEFYIKILGFINITWVYGPIRNIN